MGGTRCGTGRTEAGREGGQQWTGEKHNSDGKFAVKKELYAGQERLSKTDAVGTVDPGRDVQPAAAILTSSQGMPRSLIGKGVRQRAFVKGTGLPA